MWHRWNYAASWGAGPTVEANEPGTEVDARRGWSSLGTDSTKERLAVLMAAGIPAQYRQILGQPSQLFVPDQELDAAKRLVAEHGLALEEPNGRSDTGRPRQRLIPARQVSRAANSRFTVSGARLQVSAEPAAGLLDDVPDIKVRGATPAELVTIRADATDADDRMWTAEACFRANNEGVVDLALDAPVEGPYERADPTGMFWSMRPVEGDMGWPIRSRLSVLLTARTGSDLSQCQVHRTYARGLDNRRVEEDGLRGHFLAPKQAEGLPGVIFLGGDEGGIALAPGAFLASHGFAVLVLAYLNFPGLPNRGDTLAVDYLRAGLEWLINNAAVDPSRVSAVGFSRGA